MTIVDTIPYNNISLPAFVIISINIKANVSNIKNITFYQVQQLQSQQKALESRPEAKHSIRREEYLMIFFSKVLNLPKQMKAENHFQVLNFR